jgi:hypothetical protein
MKALLDLIEYLTTAEHNDLFKDNSIDALNEISEFDFALLVAYLLKRELRK